MFRGQFIDLWREIRSKLLSLHHILASCLCTWKQDIFIVYKRPGIYQLGSFSILERVTDITRQWTRRTPSSNPPSTEFLSVPPPVSLEGASWTESVELPPTQHHKGSGTAGEGRDESRGETEVWEAAGFLFDFAAHFSCGHCMSGQV